MNKIIPSELEQNLPQNTNSDLSKSISDSDFSNSMKKNISNNNLNSSALPMNLSEGTNQSVFNQNNINANQTQKEEGVFSRMFNYIKNNWNPWKIEEEEYIDAHGFKAKRPKTKIPLRKKDENYNNDIQKAGGESMIYATQHSGFGNIFL